MLGEPVELHGVAKHHVAAGEHPAERLAGIGTLVAPQVLAVVDVEADGNAHLVGDIECFEGGIGCLLRDGCRDA